MDENDYSFEHLPEDSILKVKDVLNVIENKQVIDVLVPQDYGTVFDLDLEDEMFTELDTNNDLGDYRIGYFQNYEDGPEGWATSGGGSDVWLIANEELYQFLKEYSEKYSKLDQPFVCQLTHGKKHFVISGDDTKKVKDDLKKNR